MNVDKIVKNLMVSFVKDNEEATLVFTLDPEGIWHLNIMTYKEIKYLIRLTDLAGTLATYGSFKDMLEDIKRVVGDE